MNCLKIITLIISSTLLLSCTSDLNSETKLTPEKLKLHLKNRNNDFIFLDNDNLTSYKTNLPEPIYFNSLEEMDEFLDQINSVSGISPNTPNVIMQYYEDPESSPTGGGGAGTNNYYVDSRYIGGLGVFINIGLNIKNCQGSNLSSWLTGFTLGVSYNHNGGFINNTQNKVSYNASGVLNYNIFVEGIGTIFSENKSYSGTYNCQ